MSAVLKSGSAALGARVRPLVPEAARVVAPAPVDPELALLRAALAEAEAALAERDRTIAGIPDRIETALAQGEARGRAAVEDDGAQRLALLGDAAERAMAFYREEMASLERLAALLALTCLDRMLLDPDDRAETVAALLRARLAALEADAAVRIEVSADDFPSSEALAALGTAPCEVVATPSLAPGDCTIRLRLGALDVGIGQQWGALRTALEEMAG